jgi:hypothetical protein
MGSNVFSGLLGSNVASGISDIGQQNAANGGQLASFYQQALQGQLASLSNQQVSNQVGQQNANSVGQIITYNGQPPIQMPNGTGIHNPQDITPDQLEEAKRDWLNKKRDQFLAFPVIHREAFLMHLRAKAVSDGMADPAMFGTTRSGWSVPPQAGLSAWLPPQIEVTLTQYEEWHADSLIDKMLESKDDDELKLERY